MKVTALVSAYYAEKFLDGRLKNLEQLLPAPEIMVICQCHSAEYKIAMQHFEAQNLNRDRYDVQTTADIPTLYKAWNVGVTWAAGEYLTSANCDDFTYPQGYNLMSRYLDAHPEIDIVYGDCDIKYAGEIRPWKRGDADLEHGINRVGVMPMWRKSLHDRFGLFDESMIVSGDYDFWLRCVRGGAKLAHINQTVGLYWKRTDSLENRNKDLMRAEDARIENA